MGWCSDRTVGELVVNGERVAIVAVCDIDCDILRSHCTRNYGQARRVACDGGRSDAVGCTVVEALGMGWCSYGAVGVLVVDGECVAIDGVGDINRHVLCAHRASDDRQVRRVTSDGRRSYAVGGTVVDALGVGCSGRCAVGVHVVDGQCVAVDAVSDIDRHVLSAHRASDDRQVRRVTSDGRRSDAVGSTVVDALGM